MLRVLSKRLTPSQVSCIVLSAVFTTDHGYTSLIDTLLCPSYVVHAPKDIAIFITGISRGLGNQLAQHFAANGFLVIGSCRKETDKQALIKQGGGNIVPVIIDQTVDEQVQAGCVEIQDVLKRKKKKLGANMVFFSRSSISEHADCGR